VEVVEDGPVGIEVVKATSIELRGTPREEDVYAVGTMTASEDETPLRQRLRRALSIKGNMTSQK